MPFQPDNSGLTPNGNMWMHGKAYFSNYGKEKLDIKAFFIHEMVHVWQHQLRVLWVRGSAVSESINHLGFYKNAYRYKLEPNTDLLDYKIEQQAAIIENYYMANYSGQFISTYLKNTERGPALLQLHQDVLQRFLKNPEYARDNIDRISQPERGWDNK